MLRLFAVCVEVVIKLPQLNPPSQKQPAYIVRTKEGRLELGW